MDSGERDDLDIISGVLGGDTDRFEELIDRHREHVFRIVGRRVPRDDVEEVAHDVFVRAWSSLPSFRNDSPFQWWLSKIAVRTCHDYWRGRYRSKETSMSSLGEGLADWLEGAAAEEPDSSFSRAESRMHARDAMMKALSGLSPSDLSLIHI